MNNILFILSYSIFPVFELELSLIQEKIDENNQIILLHCNSNQKYCSANNFKFNDYEKTKTLCSLCIHRYHNGLKWLGNEKNIRHENYFFVNKNQKKKIEKIEKILNSYKSYNDKIIKILNNYNIDILNICKTVLGTKYYNTNIELNDYYKESISIIINCLNSYYSAINQINKYKPDEIYIFNGRDSYFQPAMRVAQKMMNKNKIFIYEFPDFGGFEGLKITKNNYSHDIKNTSLQVYNKYQFAKKKITKNDIIKRSNKILKDRYKQKFDSFTGWKPNQNRKILPKNFYEKKNISIFTASEYEIRYIPENENVLNFKSQIDLIKEILKEFNKIENIKFYLRLHPAQKYENKKYLDELENYNNIEIIKSNSKINSYNLGLNSYLNIVFHSTIGLEFCAMAKETVIIGPTLYQNFNIAPVFFNKEIIKRKIKEYALDNKKIKKLINQKIALEALYAQEFFIHKTKYVNKKNYKYALMRKDEVYTSITSNRLLKYKVNVIYIIKNLLRYFGIYL